MNRDDATEILIRHASEHDRLALMRLAALDSADVVPSGPLLVAELDGALAVALSIADGTVIADPFRPTAEIVRLLQMRADTAARADDASNRLTRFARRLRGLTAPWASALRPSRL